MLFSFNKISIIALSFKDNKLHGEYFFSTLDISRLSAGTGILIFCIIDLLLGIIKVGLLPLKKNCFICYNESPLKIMKNVFYFILKGLFVLKIFKFLSWHFGHAEKKGLIR